VVLHLRAENVLVFTQCSNCETVFKLSAEVLRAAGGQVRCGKCGDVFNALAHLAEDPSAFTTSETEIDLEARADSILESPAPPTPRHAPPGTPSDEDAPPGVEIAQLQFLDDGTSMEYTLPPGELDRVFVEEEPVPEEPKRSRRVPRHTSPFDLAAPEPSGSRVKWLSAAIAAGVLLLVQVIHHNREWLSANTPLSAPLRAIYSTVGTPVTPPANLSAYQLRQWGVTGDPAGAGSLRVRASILNAAAQLEPYPLLRVTLANRFGGSIGTRDFEPSEYLGKPIAKLLAPGERVDATLDILDPGNSAEGFEVDVCLRSADRRVACANDKAPAQAKR
jgi:predicted Zn finger-like uncharacterized protein